jgi:hypothetical protein
MSAARPSASATLVRRELKSDISHAGVPDLTRPAGHPILFDSRARVVQGDGSWSFVSHDHRSINKIRIR